ncbi:MAG: hypothetical protein NZM41_10345 [Saprospiraceae bacterium]|nr:hypothetical protein [Saprospiraceae bacterium]
MFGQFSQRPGSCKRVGPLAFSSALPQHRLPSRLPNHPANMQLANMSNT